MNSHLYFQMPGRLIMGEGCLEELPGVLSRLGRRKPLIATDPGLVKAGLAERAVEVLRRGGFAPAVFDQVEPDPRIELVYECAAAATTAGADVLVGLGGGSSLDIAKTAAVIAGAGGRIEDMVGIDKVPARGLACVLLPTTAGTGSEVTPIAVLSDKREKLKKGVVSEKLLADAAIVDPLLTLGLPPGVTASTGMDALTHAIEAYTNRRAQAFVDTFALEAVRLIGANLRRAAACGDDRPARSAMALGSLYAGMCLGPVNTAAVHALAYPLGGSFEVPHGVANALLLPHVMQFNLIGDLDKFARIAEALGERIDGLSRRDAAERAPAAVRRLSADIGIVARMRELAIPEHAVDGMAESAIKVSRLLGNNPRSLGLDDARRIYRAAW